MGGMEELTVEEVAKRLQCSTKTVYRYLWAGKLPFKKLRDRTVRINDRELAKFELRANPQIKAQVHLFPDHIRLETILPLMGSGPYPPEMMPQIYSAFAAYLHSTPRAGRVVSCGIYFDTSKGGYYAEVKPPKRLSKKTAILSREVTGAELS
jgi:excisionase family DNA binding protein